MKNSKHLGFKLGLVTVTLASLVAASGTSASAVEYVETPDIVETVEDNLVITPRFRAYFRANQTIGTFTTAIGGATGTIQGGVTFAVVNPTPQHGRIQIVVSGSTRWIYQSALQAATWTGGSAF